jgi:hypothetical protein
MKAHKYLKNDIWWYQEEKHLWSYFHEHGPGDGLYWRVTKLLSKYFSFVYFLEQVK